MTTVDAVTAGSGDTYRIERVYLDRDQAYGFAQDYNGIAPMEPVQVEEWQTGAPPGPTTARTGGPSGGRGCRSASVAVSLRHTRDGERRDDFDIRREWWTGDALPEPR